MFITHFRARAARFLSYCKRSKRSSTIHQDPIGLAIFGGITLGAFCLGIWQTRRYFWKVEVLENAKSKLKSSPATISTKISQSRLAEDLVSKRGVRIAVRGVYDFSKEILLGLRAAPAGLLGPAAQGMASNPLGFYVITPLRLTDGKTVFVNRGWVPKNAKAWEQPVGEIEFIAVVSEFEKKGTFSPVNNADGNVLLWLEAEALASRMSSGSGENMTAQETVILEVVDEDNASLDRFPVARRVKDFQQHFVGPEMHVSYALTWYSLALAGVVMTARKFRGAKKKLI